MGGWHPDGGGGRQQGVNGGEVHRRHTLYNTSCSYHQLRMRTESKVAWLTTAKHLRGIGSIAITASLAGARSFR